ncbi:MAG: cystathionine beta-synthase, partial [Flavobacteriales bacterium]|nr:cystathionine beta-synthase [Flavobacteriales bacterium]
MENNKVLAFIKEVVKNMPADWLKLTTHRLDIYNEEQAKTQFLEQFETLFNNHNSDALTLNELPTAYDYIRLGHPLSCVLEWAIAKSYAVNAENVISFSSKTIPVYAVLRENSLANKITQIAYKGELPECVNAEVLQQVYGFQLELKQVE